jgi:hypothetical protein
VKTTAQILTDYEYCVRRGFWSQRYERHVLDAMEMLYRAIRTGLTESERQDFGERAGDEVMQLAEDHGLERRNHGEHYQSVINMACLADILVTALRKPSEPAWIASTPNTPGWTSSAFLDAAGTHLRRVLCVSSWNDERHLSEVRSWYGLGEVCQFELPMQMAVAIVGQMRNGRRHSPWCKGLLHPHVRGLLKFKKQVRSTTEGFKDTWQVAWREEHAEIGREKWLEAMMQDDVLREHLFVVDIPVPGENEVMRIREMAQRKLEALARLSELPEKQLTGCEGPIHPCPFRICCWANPEATPEHGWKFDKLT